MNEIISITSSNDKISTIDFRNVINDLRAKEGEAEVRNNRFVDKVVDELDLDMSVALLWQPPQGGTPQVYFMLTEEEALQVGMRESKAVRKGVVAWVNARKQPQFQLPDFTNPAEAAIAWADQWKKRELAEQSVLRLEEKINQDAPKLEVYEAIAEADSGIRITEFARVLSDKNSIGRNKLYSTLREWKILDRNNVPYQRCIEAEWFYVVERPWKNGELSGINFQVFITGKGQKYIINRLKKENVI